MGREDWYRRRTWSEEDQTAFFERLHRSRGPRNKAQYARIQASCLESVGLLEQALDLLDLVLREWPEPFELACVYWQRATCNEQLGNVHDSADNFRLALAAEREFPNRQTLARLDFAWFIVTKKLRSLYDEALELLEGDPHRPVFPVDHFRTGAVRALIYDETGRKSEASDQAR